MKMMMSENYVEMMMMMMMMITGMMITINKFFEILTKLIYNQLKLSLLFNIHKNVPIKQKHFFTHLPLMFVCINYKNQLDYYRQTKQFSWQIFSFMSKDII